MIWNKQQIIDSLTFSNHEWLYTLKEVKATRTNQQNALYHAYLADISSWFAEQGIIISANDLHEGFKQKFIQTETKINKITCEPVAITKSTTKMNKKEFSKYIEDIWFYLNQTYELNVSLRTDITYNQ